MLLGAIPYAVAVVGAISLGIVIGRALQSCCQTHENVHADTQGTVLLGLLILAAFATGVLLTFAVLHY
jgi:F0F1-type ATP synthase membrane subunit c/vacuolar-type H+-ATPase subunit K